MEDKLSIYNAGRNVPDEAKKAFNNGKFSGTDINPMWRIKKLTELFGPAGIGWYVEVLSERAEEHGDVTIAIVDLNLYVNHNGEWSKPIFGTGGNVLLRKGATSDEGYKMAYTDALSVACKALGIGADVYFEKDKTKYTVAEKSVAKADEAPETVKAARAARNEPEKFVCTDCGEVIKPVMDNGKERFSVREIAQNTEKTYGRKLCFACAKRAKAEASNA